MNARTCANLHKEISSSLDTNFLNLLDKYMLSHVYTQLESFDISVPKFDSKCFHTYIYQARKPS